MIGRLLIAIGFLWALSLFLLFEFLNAWLVVKFLAVLGIGLVAAIKFCFISSVVLATPFMLFTIIAVIQEG